jgi:hypothetical protein
MFIILEDGTDIVHPTVLQNSYVINPFAPLITILASI